jgi:hypothetical protein
VPAKTPVDVIRLVRHQAGQALSKGSAVLHQQIRGQWRPAIAASAIDRDQTVWPKAANWGAEQPPDDAWDSSWFRDGGVERQTQGKACLIHRRNSNERQYTSKFEVDDLVMVHRADRIKCLHRDHEAKPIGCMGSVTMSSCADKS